MENKLPNYDVVYEEVYKGNKTDRKMGAGWINDNGTVFIKLSFGGTFTLKKRSNNPQNTVANTYNQAKQPYNANSVSPQNEKGTCIVTRLDNYSKDGKNNFRIIGQVNGEDKTFYANEPLSWIQEGDELEFTYKKKDQTSAKGNQFSSVLFVKKLEVQQASNNAQIEGEDIEEDIPF